jgi:hypothetical protein
MVSAAASGLSAVHIDAASKPRYRNEDRQVSLRAWRGIRMQIMKQYSSLNFNKAQARAPNLSF